MVTSPRIAGASQLDRYGVHRAGTSPTACALRPSDPAGTIAIGAVDAAIRKRGPSSSEFVEGRRDDAISTCRHEVNTEIAPDAPAHTEPSIAARSARLGSQRACGMGGTRYARAERAQEGWPARQHSAGSRGLAFGGRERSLEMLSRGLAAIPSAHPASGRAPRAQKHARARISGCCWAMTSERAHRLMNGCQSWASPASPLDRDGSRNCTGLSQDPRRQLSEPA